MPKNITKTTHIKNADAKFAMEQLRAKGYDGVYLIKAFKDFYTTGYKKWCEECANAMWVIAPCGVDHVANDVAKIVGSRFAEVVASNIYAKEGFNVNILKMDIEDWVYNWYTRTTHASVARDMVISISIFARS